MSIFSINAEHVQGLAGTKMVTYWPSYVIVAVWFSCGMPTLTASTNWKVVSKTPWCSCAGQRLDLSLLLELAKAVYCCTITTHPGNVFRGTNRDFLWLVGQEKVSRIIQKQRKNLSVAPNTVLLFEKFMIFPSKTNTIAYLQTLSFEVCTCDQPHHHTPKMALRSAIFRFSAHPNLVKLYKIGYKMHTYHTHMFWEVLFVAQQA